MNAELLTEFSRRINILCRIKTYRNEEYFPDTDRMLEGISWLESELDKRNVEVREESINDALHIASYFIDDDIAHELSWEKFAMLFGMSDRGIKRVMEFSSAYDLTFYDEYAKWVSRNAKLIKECIFRFKKRNVFKDIALSCSGRLFITKDYAGEQLESINKAVNSFYSGCIKPSEYQIDAAYYATFIMDKSKELSDHERFASAFGFDFEHYHEIVKNLYYMTYSNDSLDLAFGMEYNAKDFDERIREALMG